MNFIGGLITGIVVSIIVCLVWLKLGGCKKSTEGSGPKRDIMAEAKAKHAETMKKLDRFLVGKTEVTNNEVQNYLGVSDATAERYLQALEKQGKIRQVSPEGRGVYYLKV